MDYEKVYREALERAKKWYYAPNADKMPTYANRIIKEIFPELKESEDEKIRKALIRFHKSTIDVDGIKGDDIIAWLEKQCYTKKDVDDAYLKGIIDAKNELEKQGEQKPIDYNKELKKCRENPLYFFDKYVKLEKQKPACSEEDERVKKRILLSLEKDLMATKNSGCDTQDLERCIDWLEKQGESYTKKDIDDAYIKGICVAKHELEKQGTSAKLSEEEQNSFAKGVLSRCALSFIDYLDAHSYEGKMCVSNGECEDIENAFHNAMWDRLHRYYCKYIEKQGEQKPIMNVPTREVILSIWDLGNEWKELTNGSISTEYGTQLDYIQKHWYESEYYLREKQGKQKTAVTDFNAKDWYVSKVDGKIHDMTYNPADKVEPKFKIGDYIVNDYCAGKVVALTDDAYLLDTEQGIPFSCEHNVHLWTIQDAKDGDVLIDKNYMGESPFIFKETKPSNIKTDVPNPLTVLGYCGIGGAGFTKSSGWGDTANCIYYPATKEQRELLFKKMKEAGYEWDDEKKELKKIHVIDEGKAEMDYCFTKMMAGEKANPTWNVEDSSKVQRICKYLDEAKKYYADITEVRECMDWLKSLKQRIG